MKKFELKYKVGIELTFSINNHLSLRNALLKSAPKKLYRNEEAVEQFVDNIMMTLNEKIYEDLYIKTPHDNFEEEDGIIEIGTIICNTTKELVKNYNDICKEMKSYNYLPSSISDVLKEGGGHINFDIPVQDKVEVIRYATNLRNFYRKYPALNWIFNTCNDNQNSLLDVDSIYDIYCHQSCIRLKEKDDYLIEFRPFAMPINSKEMLMYVEFAQCILQHCETMKYKLGKVPKRRSYKESVQDLKTVCKLIGFDFKRLEYKLPNLKNRYRLGKSYLV